MTTSTLMLSDLVGRKVRDQGGRVVGRLLELSAEIVLHENGNDYVVRHYHVANFGALNGLAGPRFVQGLLATVGRVLGVRQYLVPWDAMDLNDVRRPRLTRMIEPEWLDQGA